MRGTKFAIAVALAGCATMAASAPTKDAETKFAEATAGLIPGKPMDCMNNRFVQTSLDAVGKRLLYKVNRGLVYVNESTGGCERVARGDALITRSYGGRLCRGDIAQTVDLPARIPTGSCALGRFIPYSASGKVQG